MNPPDLLQALLDLARELELEVRRVGPLGDEPARSGLCRLRGRLWVLLSPGDPLERRIGVLAAGLREHAGEACEARFLPPAVRAALEGEAPDATAFPRGTHGPGRQDWGA